MDMLLKGDLIDEWRRLESFQLPARSMDTLSSYDNPPNKLTDYIFSLEKSLGSLNMMWILGSSVARCLSQPPWLRFQCTSSNTSLKNPCSLPVNTIIQYRNCSIRTLVFYKNMRVSSGVIFEICGVLIMQFLLKKWTFVEKKWRFIQICPKWRSICADSVGNSNIATSGNTAQCIWGVYFLTSLSNSSCSSSI